MTLAQVLVRRGIAEPAHAQAFLAADEEHPPQAFTGIERACAAILRHLATGARCLHVAKIGQEVNQARQPLGQRSVVCALALQAQHVENLTARGHQPA